MPIVANSCGPCLIAALTGQPYAAAEWALADAGADPACVRPLDLKHALEVFGFSMAPVEIWQEPFSSPSLLDWLDAAPDRWRRRRLLAVMLEQPDETFGHCVAVWGDGVLDSLSRGQWRWLRDSEHRASHMSSAWSVWPPSGRWPRVLDSVRYG